MTERRGVSIWLAASLALNAALIGVVGVHALRPTPDRGPAFDAAETREIRTREFRNLSGDERRKFRRDMVQVWRGSAEDRETLTAARRRAADLMAADEFDREAMAAALAEIRAAEAAIRTRLHETMLDRVETQTPEQRARWLRLVERPERGGRGHERGGPPDGPGD